MAINYIIFNRLFFTPKKRERERDGKERRGRKENIQNAWIGFDRFAPCLRSAPGDPLESSLCSMQHVRNTHIHTCTHTNTGSEAGTHNLSVECVILYFRRSKFSYDNVGSTRRQGRIFFSSALPDCPQSLLLPLLLLLSPLLFQLQKCSNYDKFAADVDVDSHNSCNYFYIEKNKT